MLPVVRRGVGCAGLGAGAPPGSGRPTANGKGLAAQPLRGAAGWGRRPASLAVLLHRSVPVLGHSRWSAAGLPRARPSRCGALSPVSRWRAGCPLLPAVVPPEVGCGGRDLGLLSARSAPCLWQSLGTSRGCAGGSGAEHPCEGWFWWGLRK